MFCYHFVLLISVHLVIQSNNNIWFCDSQLEKQLSLHTCQNSEFQPKKPTLNTVKSLLGMQYLMGQAIILYIHICWLECIVEIKLLVLHLPAHTRTTIPWEFFPFQVLAWSNFYWSEDKELWNSTKQTTTYIEHFFFLKQPKMSTIE